MAFCAFDVYPSWLVAASCTQPVNQHDVVCAGQHGLPLSQVPESMLLPGNNGVVT